MTREETIVNLEKLIALFHTASEQSKMVDYSKIIETLEFAAAALRPVSREQVEKVWPGCDFCNMADFGEFGFEITKHYAKIRCALGSWRFPGKEQFLFCPKCGKPLTDEAVEMVMERLEALFGERNDD